MKEDIIERTKELQEGLEKLYNEVPKRIKDTAAVTNVLTDLVIARRNLDMTLSLINTNFRDAFYYFSRACILIGHAQGRIHGM